MDCISGCSSATPVISFSSSFQASLVSENCSSSMICSVASAGVGGNWRVLNRLSYCGSSPHFTNVSGSSLRTSTTVSSSAPLVLCSDALQTQDLPSPTPRDEDTISQNLSAKERRKLRNERREAAKLAQEQPWREAVQDRLLEKKKKIKSWREDADINQCIARGVQWWMIQTTKKYEFDVAEQIERVFPEEFPGREFQVLVPTVPVMTKLKDGSVSQARKKLYEGIVLLRCLLDREVYFTVKKIPRAFEFFGTQAGLSLQPIVMPAPVSNFNMEIMLQKIRKREAEYEEFKEQCRIELEEQNKEKMRKKEEKQRKGVERVGLKSKGLVLMPGSTVRVLSGPFLDFTGVVIELLPKNKIKVVVTVFGNDTLIMLDRGDVAVEAAVNQEKSGMMYNA